MLADEKIFDRATLFGPPMTMKPQMLPASVNAVHKPNTIAETMDFSFMMSDSFLRFPIKVTSQNVVVLKRNYFTCLAVVQATIANTSIQRAIHHRSFGRGISMA